MADRLPRRAGAVAVWSDFCAACPSPELRERLQEEQQRIRSASPLASQFVVSGAPRPLGFDDGTIIPRPHAVLLRANRPRHPAIRAATSSRIDGMAVYNVPGQSVASQWRCPPMAGAGRLIPLTGLR